MALKQIAGTAAKKSAKKAAKKAPAKHAAKHAAKKSAHGNPGKDTRRAYEHLGRIQSLAAALPGGTEDAQTLATHAQNAMRAEQAKDAAELLRASEHNLFAILQNTQPADESVAASLLSALHEEVEHLLQRAEDHGACAEAPRAIQTIYRSMSRAAVVALKAKRYRAAMEFARGAEALTHADFRKILPKGKDAALLR
ncbi:hypothetical protein [Terriglobus roseus]|uniref:Uncharacterized protein n=1 Tax=Terriglobus roseus TaxID=392734 RepID=A0A1H4PQZ4_9BACT|nr:hypothetical protein [Terriglobus roseus]SEC09826.1 hypothetical protein SAMN05443244_2645 [Terriglobus roseus]